MPEIFTYGFMQRAFIAGSIIGIICPAIGVFIVLRRLSMIGDTLSHMALAGVAAGLLAGIYPIYSALAFSVIASLGVEKLRQGFKEYAELSIAIVLSAGIGLASIFISMGGSNSAIFSYLFGSITLVTLRDIVTVAILGLVILGSLLVFYRSLFYITFDEEAARLAGIPVKRVNLYFSILVAGILLVSSMMVVPVAAGMQIAKSFKDTLLYSILFGLSSVLVGLFISFYLDLAPGGTIVISGILLLALTMGLKGLHFRVAISASRKSAL
jgi:zinc transport system permease protein